MSCEILFFHWSHCASDENGIGFQVQFLESAKDTSYAVAGARKGKQRKWKSACPVTKDPNLRGTKTSPPGCNRTTNSETIQKDSSSLCYTLWCWMWNSCAGKSRVQSCVCVWKFCVQKSGAWKSRGGRIVCVCVCGTKLCARVVHGRVDRERAAGKELYLAMKTVTSVT